MTKTILIIILFTSCKSSSQNSLEICRKLSKEVQEVILTKKVNSNTNFYKDYLTMPVVLKDSAKFEKFLLFNEDKLTKGITEFETIYDSKENELLGTDIFVGSPDLDGIILQSKPKSIYDVSVDYLGRKTVSTTPREYLTLTYITFPNKKVVCRDTIWGSKPPFRMNYEEASKFNGEVKIEDIVMSIRIKIK